VGDFYGTGIEIWAVFLPVGITKKKFGPIMSNFLGWFLHVFMDKKTRKKNIVASALKSWIK
jgi:hypothetical protein